MTIAQKKNFFLGGRDFGLLDIPCSRFSCHFHIVTEPYLTYTICLPTMYDVFGFSQYKGMVSISVDQLWPWHILNKKISRFSFVYFLTKIFYRNDLFQVHYFNVPLIYVAHTRSRSMYVRWKFKVSRQFFFLHFILMEI